MSSTDGNREEGTVLGLEDFMTIQALAKRGVYVCEIAAQLGVHPKTARRALQRGEPPAPRRGRRGSLLDPYRGVIDGLVADGVWNAVVIWRELQVRGYAGGVSIIRGYVRPKRGLRPGRATVRFETEPGRQVQTDWGQQPTVIAGRAVIARFAVSTLGYSRRFHFWGTDCEDAEHTYEALVRAFEWFGGVPGEVLVITRRAR
jgi:transposase